METESGYDQPDQSVFQQITGVSDKYDPSPDAVYDEKYIRKLSGSSCFLKNFLIGAIVSLYILADKEGFVAKQKWLFMQFFQPNGQPFLFIPCVLRIKPLVDLSAERSWIPQLSVYCVMLEHRSSEPHMRFWSCDRRCYKCYSVFRAISGSSSVFSSYFAGRSHSELVFPDLYSDPSAV